MLHWVRWDTPVQGKQFAVIGNHRTMLRGKVERAVMVVGGLVLADPCPAKKDQILFYYGSIEPEL